ncbi:homoserine kinase [Alkalihalobacillus sp. CinArs1]|uniref:homoserine kinase n=1 Tax=Alkalihalobacillus sp. CinArs1 TaxID=2995314 RepID=UPI0022DDE956|nr:homoserine kinase [Alkalihalobacillus sp. CinArs1]
MKQPVSLKIPGSTSNLGPGFDSIGLAINRYLHVKFEPSSEWAFYYIGFQETFPQGKENLVYKVIESIAVSVQKTPEPQRVTMTSELPLERGLGSSAAAIVAGVEIADITMGLALTSKEKVRYAAEFEGHADNVAASIYGGLVIASGLGDLDSVVQNVENVEFVALIPERKLKTTDSRSVLPKSLTFEEAVKASSVANVFTAAAVSNNWQQAGALMNEDLFHQPYRKHFVPDLERVQRLAVDWGAYGAALSGAGPTLLIFTPIGTAKKLKAVMEANLTGYDCVELFPTNTGVQRMNDVLQR